MPFFNDEDLKKQLCLKFSNAKNTVSVNFKRNCSEKDIFNDRTVIFYKST